MVEKAPPLIAKTFDTFKVAAKQCRVYRRRGRRRSRYRRHKVRPRKRAIPVFLGAFAKLVRERKYLHERTPRSRVRRSASRIDRGEGTDIIFHRQRGSMRSPNSRYLRPRRPALVNRSLLESLHRGRYHALYRESMFEEQHRGPTIQAKFGFANDTARILRNTPVPRVVKRPQEVRRMAITVTNGDITRCLHTFLIFLFLTTTYNKNETDVDFREPRRSIPREISEFLRHFGPVKG